MAISGDASALLAPMITLVLWTFVMQIWLYALRIPAMNKAGLKPQPNMTTQDMNRSIPRHQQWPADNYNHLHEQPTVFYAVVCALAVLGANNTFNERTAWAYVTLRIVHSLIQATVNKIMLRFQVFALSSVALLVLSARAAVLVF